MNAIGQRTNVSQTGSAFQGSAGILPASRNIAYQFDSIGNCEKSAESLVLPTANNYVTNALNQYTSRSVGVSPTLNPEYDSDSNATAYPLPAAPNANSTLSWDAENRLIETQVGTSGPLVRNHYDAQSRRIAKTVGTTTTLYLYDAWNVIAEYSSPNFQSLISHVRSYLWGLDLSGTFQGAGGVGGLLSVSLITNNSITDNHYPTYDGNGNVSEYLKSSGEVIAHFEYDPFGNTVVNTDSAGQFNYRFSTKPLDAETGLYYYGYRYYDPLTGRWPSRDPIEERGGVNLYGFAGNDLQNWIDYLGLIEKKKDDFGRECCEDEMVTITIYTSPAGSSGSGSSSSGGKNVGHTYMHHPNVGYRGNYPSGYEDESKHGRPKKGDKKSKELKACPESAKKIEDDMKKREKAGKNYGLGPGGKPNCTEAACDIIENAGHDMPNDWTPSGLHDSLQ